MVKYKVKTLKYWGWLQKCPVCGKAHTTSHSKEGYGYGVGSGYLPEPLPGMKKYVRVEHWTTDEGKPGNPIFFHEIPAKEFEKIFLKEFSWLIKIVEKKRKHDIKLAKTIYKKHEISNFKMLDNSYACWDAVNEIDMKKKGRK